MLLKTKSTFKVVFQFRLTEALKSGGLEKNLINLGLDKGIGSKGELTLEEINFSIDGEDRDCESIEENVRLANQTLEAALPGTLV